MKMYLLKTMYGSRFVSARVQRQIGWTRIHSISKLAWGYSFKLGILGMAFCIEIVPWLPVEE